MQKPNLARAKQLLDLHFYLQSAIFSTLVFALTYAYLSWQGIPGTLNKATADTATLLIGLSMIASGLAYFFNFADRLVIYRKHVGVIGFFFAVWHMILSWSALLNLLKIETWESGKMGPALTGLIALVIFAVMALISNQLSTRLLGTKLWRGILRFGYVALALVIAHVFLLKSARWLTWYEGGMSTPPALSLVVTIFALLVILVRLLLWFSLMRRRAR